MPLDTLQALESDLLSPDMTLADRIAWATGGTVRRGDWPTTLPEWASEGTRVTLQGGDLVTVLGVVPTTFQVRVRSADDRTYLVASSSVRSAAEEEA